MRILLLSSLSLYCVCQALMPPELEAELGVESVHSGLVCLHRPTFLIRDTGGGSHTSTLCSFFSSLGPDKCSLSGDSSFGLPQHSLLWQGSQACKNFRSLVTLDPPRSESREGWPTPDAWPTSSFLCRLGPWLTGWCQPQCEWSSHFN